jgi:hypothetical protein
LKDYNQEEMRTCPQKEPKPRVMDHLLFMITETREALRKKYIKWLLFAISPPVLIELLNCCSFKICIVEEILKNHDTTQRQV